MAHEHKTINYIEFPLKDADTTKIFYGSVFGWEFQDWGANYLSFSGAGVDGGFSAEDATPVQKPGVLVVLFSKNLEATLAKVKAAGATILRAGDRVSAGEIGLLASQNIDRVPVFRQPKVALLSPGDERRELAAELEPGAIVNSNLYMLTEMLREQPI